MIAEVHQARLSRFRRGYRDAVDSVPTSFPKQRKKIADWCVDNWPVDQPFLGRDGLEDYLTEKYRSDFGTIWVIILGALLSAVFRKLIDHWFSGNVRKGP